MMQFHILFYCILSVGADIYLHNPRGSNNRLDEQGRERSNKNRLFDTQNNNRGGYNVGSLYYYSGSRLQIEWTNQHSCGNEKSHCEIIIQYMCGSHVRDGVTTATIPENPKDCHNNDCNTDKRYGMHENYEHYAECTKRQRNEGLFTADQNVGSRAKYTRQNPKGKRYGYECPEERDYYPYWHHSPWKDIVIMTNNVTRCPYYQSESQNVKSRWHCILPPDVMRLHMNDPNLELPNNEIDCANFKYPKNSENGTRGQWVKIEAHGLPAPECLENQYTRDNHLGNTIGGYPPSYNWTVPNLEQENCVLRIRYNVSTDDYAAWDGVDSSNNKQKGQDYSDLDLSNLMKLPNQEAATQRGYVFKNNPEVQIFKDLDLQWKLAINTAQYGRVFQDRSHVFAVRRRPPSIEQGTIHNLNVRGKRGNIVQVYPAVEYDFFPNTLVTKIGDYIHFQWTGSNTNPPNNNGQGLQRTDRSNLVLQASQVYAEGSGLPYVNNRKYGHWGRSYPQHLDNATFLELSREDLVKLAILKPQFRGEMSELDDAGTYFDLGPRKITKTGVYHFLCTRNNNFSSRSQKGRIIVNNHELLQKAIGWNGGNITLADGMTSIIVPRGAFDQLHIIQVEKWDKHLAKDKLKKLEKVPPSDNLAADLIIISPERRLAVEGETFRLLTPYKASSLHQTVVYTSLSNGYTWVRVESTTSEGLLSIRAHSGGMYIITSQLNIGAVIGIVVTVITSLAVITGIVVFVLRKRLPSTWTSCGSKP